MQATGAPDTPVAGDYISRNFKRKKVAMTTVISIGGMHRNEIEKILQNTCILCILSFRNFYCRLIEMNEMKYRANIQ